MNTQYELGRHDERKRTMQIIGGVRMDIQTGAVGDALDKLVMCLASEPLPDMMLDYARALATPADLAPAGERDEEEWVKQNPEAQLESAAGELVSREAHLIAQLEKLSLADPCECEHNNENCCVVVGEPCATCALAALPPVARVPVAQALVEKEE